MRSVSDLPGRADVLVIGSGGAGLAAAWAAAGAGADVVLVTKGSRASCNTGMAHGGIQAAVHPEDSPERHAQDVLDSSHGTADPELVSVLTSEAPEAIAWLESIGVEFSRDGGGYRLARCGGASVPRLLQVGDRTGHAIAKALRAELDRRGIAIHDHTALVGLERPNGSFRATLRHGDDERRLDAAAVVLAAGGRCYAEAQRPPASSPRTSPARPARRPRSPARSAPRCATTTRSSTIPPAAPGRRRCRASRSRRRAAATARRCVNAAGERFCDELAPARHGGRGDRARVRGRPRPDDARTAARRCTWTPP